jgi:hypothetical protein
VTEVYLSDELMRAARRAAAKSRRSVVAQIEFWVTLGRDVEDKISPETTRKLLDRERGLRTAGRRRVVRGGLRAAAERRRPRPKRSPKRKRP